jgi:hypothetical protein
MPVRHPCPPIAATGVAPLIPNNPGIADEFGWHALNCEVPVLVSAGREATRPDDPGGTRPASLVGD